MTQQQGAEAAHEEALAEDDEEDAGGEDGEVRRQEARAHHQPRARYEQAHEESLHLRRAVTPPQAAVEATLDHVERCDSRRDWVENPRGVPAS